jgi:hypothetical protein
LSLWVWSNSPPVASGSNYSSAAWAFDIDAFARLIDIASKLGNHILYLIVVQKKGGLDKKEMREGTLLKVGHAIVHKVRDPNWKRNPTSVVAGT